MELRQRIFRLLEERERSHQGLPKVAEIATALGEPVRNVVVMLRSSEAMGMVELVSAFGEDEEDFDVLLKPPAYIYLEQHLE